MKKFFFLSFFLFSVILMQAQSQKPVPVIFDTDMGPDYDDAGAITLLHAYADAGKAKILATVASTKYEGVAAVLNVFNTYFKRPGTLIGVPKGEASTRRDSQHWTDSLIKNYPHAIKSNKDVPDAVDVYRKILAKQADKSVTIITVGFLTNLSNLLTSKPDKYSPLTGRQLVEKKVKSLVSMAGKFPSGREFNIYMDGPAAKYVYSNWNTPVIFSGFEIGEKIKTGLPLINNNAIKNSPVKDVFRICIPLDKNDKDGRMSWDETAVLVAIAGYKPYYKLKSGTIEISDDGSNTFNDKGGNHFYLIENRPALEVQNIINKMIMHQPK
ncbi:MAG: ribonucleoside hydrolase RihC [Segetibacter sp.]|nr:ribonucleoside hydrolase RihC [Segetibacter sp.]